jgi:hypothetical protein
LLSQIRFEYNVTLVYQAHGGMNHLLVELHFVDVLYLIHTIQPALAYPSDGTCCSGSTRLAGPGRAASARSRTAHCTPYDAATHYRCFVNTDGVLEAGFVRARHLVRSKGLRFGIGLGSTFTRFIAESDICCGV